MNYKKYLMSLTVIFFSAFLLQAQTKSAAKPAPETLKVVKSSAAYAEILLYRTELEAELEDLLVAYTLEYPKVKEIQFQLGLIKIEMDKLFTVKSEEKEKLTLALGKLILRKIQLETDLWNLKKQYSDDHPEVRKTNRKVLVFEAAIKDVLF